MAELSPHLATLFCGTAAMAWVSMSAPPLFWIGNLVVGLVAGLLLVRLYRTGDTGYTTLYAALLALSLVIGDAVFDSAGIVLKLGGLLAFLGGAMLTVAIRRRSVLEAAQNPG